MTLNPFMLSSVMAPHCVHRQCLTHSLALPSLCGFICAGFCAVTSDDIRGGSVGPCVLMLSFWLG